MGNYEDEKQSILSRLGDEARKILEEAGIDVEEGIERVLEERDWQFEVTRGGQIVELRRLPTQDILTSELVHLCALPGDNSEYRQELARRFSLLELTEEQKEMFTALDLAALEKKDPRLKIKALAVGYFILPDTTIETLPNPESCLTSELIMVEDDANAALARDHHWLPDEAFTAAIFIRGEIHYDDEKQSWILDKKGPYMEEYERRFDLMGFKEWQRNSFIKNECLITARAKWGYSPQEKSWTPGAIVKERKWWQT